MPRRDTSTLDLFEVPAAPALIGGSLDYDRELCAVLTEAIEKSGMTRYQIGARISELCNDDVTKSMLDAWTAASKQEWRFPFKFAAAFEVATNSTCLQELLGRKRGSRILVGEDTLLAEMGRLDLEEQRIKRRRTVLKSFLSRGKSA